MNFVKSLFVTLIAVSLQVACISAQDGGNSNTILCEFCLPPSSNPTKAPEQSEEDAIIQARCYTACIEDIGVSSR